MPQPVWVTPSGSLGVIPEGEFYSVSIEATAGESAVFYKLLAGDLPEGIQVKSNGLIEGIPRTTGVIQGVPNPVPADVTSKFAVRAYTIRTVLGQTIVDRLADRTFTITVTDQNTPEFLTPPGNIGTFYDGTKVSIQVDVTGIDEEDDIEITIIDGELPPGLYLNKKTGLISGVILPLEPPSIEFPPDYDMSPYDAYLYDFISLAPSRNFPFTLKVTNGVSSSVTTFGIFVFNKSSMTADTVTITADETFVTSDVTPDRVPVILTDEGFIGTYRSDNFFAFRFKGIDFDNQPFEFVLSSGTLPPGLTLDPTTGYLYGYMPNQGATEITYNFSLRVRQKIELAEPWNPFVPYYTDDVVSYLGKNYQALEPVSAGLLPTNGTYWYWLQVPISLPYDYSMTVIGDIETEITWISPSNLGTIDNGALSLFAIEAISASNKVLQYRLKPGPGPAENYIPGIYNKLPQGLKLLPSGHISGRVSFDTFALDSGTTTFDGTRQSGNEARPTTFDSVFNFTVETYSSDGLISTFKDFSITVNRAYNEPYESLYIKAMPGLEDRAIIDNLLLNQDIMNPDLIFRDDDPWYGVSRQVIYQHAFGLKTATLEKYVEALELNHFKKTLVLGEIKVAQARYNNNGDVAYEVVYSEIIDSGVNDQGQSPPQSVPVAYPFIDPYNPAQTISKVYPNSLIEMRTQVVDTIGQFSRVLPLWMTSKQANGRVLGFVKAFVIAYAKPGKGNQLAYNIRTQWGYRLNLIDFQADRLILDKLMTRNWVAFDDSSIQGAWEPPPSSTTFDNLPYYNLQTTGLGTGFAVNDTLKILGSNLGGVNGINDLNILVTQVDSFGRILAGNYYGTVNGSVIINTAFNLVPAVNVNSFGTGAQFNVTVLLADGTTIFDGGSLRFNAPADQWEYTDEYNKYLMFPKVNILGPNLQS